MSDGRSNPRPGARGIMHRHFTQSPDSPRMKAIAARRARYAELRQEGKTPFEAVQEIGVDPWAGAARYERWYKAFPPDGGESA